MCGGRLVGVVDGGEDRDVLGLMMAGVPVDEARAQAADHHTVLGEADLEVDPATAVEPVPHPAQDQEEGR
jgi:simple sugar transport system ATP-binding protein